MESCDKIVPNLKLYHDEGSNCIQDVFYMLLRNMNMDPVYLYSDNWSFRLHSDDVLNVDVYRDGFNSLYKVLDTCYGIKIEELDYDNETLQEFLNSQIRNNKLILARVDPYYCAWHRIAQLYHAEHYVIIIGIQDRNFLCLDPYTSKNVESISGEYLKMMNAAFWEIKLQNVECQLNELDVLENSVRACLEGYKGISDFEQMRILAQKIKNIDFVRKDASSYTNIAFYPMILRMHIIGLGRKNFGRFVREVNQKTDLFYKNIEENWNEIANEWSKTSGLLIKYIRSQYKEEYANILSDRFRQLAVTEEALASKIMERIGANYHE